MHFPFEFWVYDDLILNKHGFHFNPMKDMFEVVALPSLNVLSNAYCILNEIPWHFSRRVNLRKVRIFLKYKSFVLFSLLSWLLCGDFWLFLNNWVLIYLCWGLCTFCGLNHRGRGGTLLSVIEKHIRLLHWGLNERLKTILCWPFFSYRVPQLRRFPESFSAKWG